MTRAEFQKVSTVQILHQFILCTLLLTINSWSWLLLLLSTKEDKKFSNCSSVRPRILKSNAIGRVVLIGRARVRCRLHVRMKLCTCSRHAHYCIDPTQCLEYGSCNLIMRSRVTNVYFFCFSKWNKCSTQMPMRRNPTIYVTHRS